MKLQFWEREYVHYYYCMGHSRNTQCGYYLACRDPVNPTLSTTASTTAKLRLLKRWRHVCRAPGVLHFPLSVYKLSAPQQAWHGHYIVFCCFCVNGKLKTAMCRCLFSQKCTLLEKKISLLSELHLS